METFKDGQIQLYHGDSAHILNEVLESESVDLTVTSPPYDAMRTYNGHSQFDFERIAQGLYRVTKHGGVVVWVVNDQTKNGCESLTSFKQAIYFVEGCGFNIHDTMIYEGNGWLDFPRLYIQTFEYMFVFSKGTPKTFNAIEDRENKYLYLERRTTRREPDGSLRSRVTPANKEFSKRKNIWRIVSGHGRNDLISEEHPAIFPEALARDHILSWSSAGDTVLDCFAAVARL